MKQRRVYSVFHVIIIITLCVLLFILPTACATRNTISSSLTQATLNTLIGKNWQDAAKELNCNEASLQTEKEAYRDRYIPLPESVKHLGKEWYVILELNSFDPECPDQIIGYMYARHYSGDSLKKAVNDAFLFREKLIEELGTPNPNGLVVASLSKDDFMKSFPESTSVVGLDSWKPSTGIAVGLTIMTDANEDIVILLSYHKG